MNTITELKNSTQGFNNKLDKMEERISKLKNRAEDKKNKKKKE